MTDAKLRERAHALAHEQANRYSAACMDHEVLGWSHGPRCMDIEDAVLDALKRVRDEARLEHVEVLAERLQARVEAAQLRQRVADLESRTSADPMLDLDKPWPLVSFVDVLVNAVGHLLTAHSCDHHGWEETTAARDAASAWLKRYDDATHGGTPTTERAEGDSGSIPSTNQRAERNVMPRVNGKGFHCDCGCNVFTEFAPFKYRCNSCDAQYNGEPVPSASAGGGGRVRNQEILPVGTPANNAGTGTP